MKSLFLLLLFCHVSSPVKHSLKFLFTGSSGIQNLPELVIVALVDDVQAGYCNSNKTIEIHQEEWKKLSKDNPGIMELCTRQCFDELPKLFKTILDRIMQHFNQTEGFHILQMIQSFESDEKTGKSFSVQCGYDGEDFMSLDLKNRKWIPLKPEADVVKQDKVLTEDTVHFVTQIYPDWLSNFVNYGRSFLLRTVPPSVSLLQKSPSSPVSCHATGFYPDRATVFWRKDGQELHEDVVHGEILPNHDGTFQMRVDLKLSSVKPEDWRIYDCVFQLYGVKDNIITKLDKTVIRSNWENTGTRNNEGPPSVKKSVNWTKWENTGTRNNEIPAPRSRVPVVAVIGVAVGLMLLTACITGLFIWRKNNGFQPANSSNTNSGPTVIDLSSI